MALGDGTGVEGATQGEVWREAQVLSVQLVTDQGVCVRKLQSLRREPRRGTGRNDPWYSTAAGVETLYFRRYHLENSWEMGLGSRGEILTLD